MFVYGRYRLLETIGCHKISSSQSMLDYPFEFLMIIRFHIIAIDRYRNDDLVIELLRDSPFLIVIMIGITTLQILCDTWRKQRNKDLSRVDGIINLLLIIITAIEPGIIQPYVISLLKKKKK